MTPKLDRLVDRLDRCIAEAAAADLSETAELLRMARLDLISRANGVSPEEFELFLFALKAGLRAAHYPVPPVSSGRDRKGLRVVTGN